MPFNKQKLSKDIENALALPVPRGDDRARVMVRKTATALATAIENEPAKQVLDNEELIKLLQTRVDDLEARVQELQDFFEKLDVRVTDVETKVPGGAGGAGGV